MLENCVSEMLCEDCGTEIDNIEGNDCDCVCHTLV